jgi:DNA uptake protein ComE-like DNA-binding protein
MRRFVTLLLTALVIMGLSLPVALAGQQMDMKTAPAMPGGMHGQGHTGEMDINTASVDDLKHIPGLGEAYAKKIVENRPYKRKDELVTKKVVPLATYESIKDHLAAGPVKK